MDDCKREVACKDCPCKCEEYLYWLRMQEENDDED